MEFGQRLRQLRQGRGLTLRQLAEAVGVDFTYLSKIENGKAGYLPGAETIRLLARVLEADALELLQLADKVPPEMESFAGDAKARRSCSVPKKSPPPVTGTLCSSCLRSGRRIAIRGGAMSDTVKWSFSTDRCMRRCQRQYFLQHVAAWHNALDPVRKESFLLKQVKTLELWTGSLVHRGIELYVVPALQADRLIDWQQAIAETSAMARRQFEFSKARRYREKIIKGKAGDDYCALLGHETEDGVPPAELERVLGTVERAFLNFSEMGELLAEISGRDRYWPELKVRLAYDTARIEVRIDLLFFREYGKPTIVDWKVSESLGASDADLQTALYGWALCQHPSWAVTKAEDCELLEIQLLTKTVMRHRATQETFDRLEDRIYRSVSTIKSLRGSEKYDLADLENYDFAENPNSCVFCSHRSLCRQLAAEEARKTATEPTPSPTSKEKRRHVASHAQLF